MFPRLGTIQLIGQLTGIGGSKSPTLPDRYDMGKTLRDCLPVMNYLQYRCARRLVHECCNYDRGDCFLLDDGEGFICVQSISYTLVCKWFRVAVLPLDKELENALFHRADAKKCIVCGGLFLPSSNRAKYCPDCVARMKRIKATQRKRKQRQKCHALDHFKAL